MVNELYRDAVDGHASYVAPLGRECLTRVATLWEETNGGRTLEPLERYEKLLEFAGLRRWTAGSHTPACGGRG